MLMGTQHERPIRVLQSLNAADGTTRYVDQISEYLPQDIRLSYFSWRTALSGQFDLFHVHWPEALFRDPSSLKSWAKRLAFRLLLRRLSRKNIPIVRTAHNLTPHEGVSVPEMQLIDALDERTALYIKINSTTELPTAKEFVTILHGHYVDRFSQYTRDLVVRRKILYFGLIRPYKGVDDLLSAYATADIAGATLRIVGQPSTKELAELIVSSSENDSSVSSLLEFVDDRTLVSEISSAHLVVLPYKQMHNSGVLLVALSLGKHVLVPKTPANDAIANEVGASWVQRYDGQLTSATLRAALSAVEAMRPDTLPELTGRDWSVVGEEHARTYRDMLKREDPGYQHTRNASMSPVATSNRQK